MGALQNFIDNSLPSIKAAWLNQVDSFVNTLFNGATTAAQARDALNINPQPTFRNRIMNGRWQVAQFANVITVASSGYIIDQWVGFGTTGTFAIQRVAAVGLADHPYFGRIGSSAANTVAAGDFWFVQQYIEGLNIDDLNWGTSSAATVTLSFWARTSVPGTYSIALRDSTATQSYVTAFVSTDNAWHQYAFTISGPTTGNWPILNAKSIQLTFVASCGSTYQTSTLGTWQPGNFIASPNQTQMMTTNGATFDLTGVQLERGAVATSFEQTGVDTELSRLQRYYELVSYLNIGYAPVAPMVVASNASEKVTKRTTPSISPVVVLSTTGISSAAFGYQSLGPSHVVLTIGVTGTWNYQVVLAVDARL